MLLLAACGAALAVAGCGTSDSPSDTPARAAATTPPPTAGGRLPRGAERVRLRPSDFTTRVDNTYWPMTPGSRWVYRESSGGGPSTRVVITVLRRTKVVAGVRALVLHDVDSRSGEKVEDTFDWVAQDRAGNIWYLGEDTREYENGRPGSKAGSWQAGVDGAQAGILVPARPRPGLEYRQEYRKGEAEDAARVLRVGARARTPFRRFAHTLETEDFSPLEPGAVEHKFYAPGVGLVLSASRGSREALISYRRGGR